MTDPRTARSHHGGLDTRETMNIRRWTTPNDPNHQNHHIEYKNVQLVRLPYQYYTGRLGDNATAGALTFSMSLDRNTASFGVAVALPDGARAHLETMYGNDEDAVIREGVDFALAHFDRLRDFIAASGTPLEYAQQYRSQEQK